MGPAQIVWQPILFSLLSPLGLHVLIIEREAYCGSVFLFFPGAVEPGSGF